MKYALLSLSLWSYSAQAQQGMVVVEESDGNNTSNELC